MRKTVDLICINDALEAVALRAALDWWNIEGRLHLIGKASDLVALLNGSYLLSQNIALLCHATIEGIVLPELAEEIAINEPYNKFLSAPNIAEFTKLSGAAVLNTGCITGTQGFADAFLLNGAAHYIAPSDYPSGNASLFFALSFYYYHLAKEMNVEEAFRRSRNSEEEMEMFQLFRN
jgi:hypothetical protein